MNINGTVQNIGTGFNPNGFTFNNSNAFNSLLASGAGGAEPVGTGQNLSYNISGVTPDPNARPLAIGNGLNGTGPGQIVTPIVNPGTGGGRLTPVIR